MRISAIVAISDNFAIGEKEMIPWYLPADLKYFRDLTIGHTVVMGRKTYHSIGKPLPKRHNIVITSDPFFISSHFHTVHSINEAMELALGLGETETFIIGGGQIYKQSVSLWDRMYVTKVNISVPDADTFFPEWDEKEWKIISEVTNMPDEKNKFKSQFLIYDRIV
ncbi:MAG: dihydrofolate reductase [Bacteroidetes bacterium]|nr:dihydrofolate reductase [Bacteroidota bacterium]